jgi:hypothetical protein
MPAHDRLQHTDDCVGHGIPRSYTQHAIRYRSPVEQSGADVRNGEPADDVSAGPKLIARVGDAGQYSGPMRERRGTSLLIQKRGANECDASARPERRRPGTELDLSAGLGGRVDNAERQQ